MNLLNKKLLKISSGMTFCILSAFVPAGNQAKANVCDGSAPLTAACYITPTTYKVTVYEMGLCTSDPLAGTYLDASDSIVTDNAIDESTCTATYTSSSPLGFQIDLGTPGLSGTLRGNALRPLRGTYPHAYIKIKNTFGLKGSYTHDGTKYYTQASGGKTTDSSASVEWDEDLMDFNNGPTCGGSPELAGSETFTSGVTGTMKAVLAQDIAGTYVGETSCTGNSTRLFGSFQPTAPVVITDTTQGLQVTFTVTDRGMTVIPDGLGGMQGFAGGPFSPSFSTF